MFVLPESCYHILLQTRVQLRIAEQVLLALEVLVIVAQRFAPQLLPTCVTPELVNVAAQLYVPQMTQIIRHATVQPE